MDDHFWTPLYTVLVCRLISVRLWNFKDGEHHYNSRFIYFLPTFWSPKTFFQGAFFLQFWPYVWLVFKSGFKSRAGYDGSCMVLCIILIKNNLVINFKNCPTLVIHKLNHHNPLLMINCAWIPTIHKARIVRKKPIK